jgi:hypothetical protein
VAFENRKSILLKAVFLCPTVLSVGSISQHNPTLPSLSQATFRDPLAVRIPSTLSQFALCHASRRESPHAPSKVSFHFLPDPLPVSPRPNDALRISRGAQLPLVPRS